MKFFEKMFGGANKGKKESPAPKEETLVDLGPAAKSEEPALQKGEPLYFAFIDPDALSLSPEDVQEAKNKLANVHPDKIKMCKGKSASECRKILNSAEPEGGIDAEGSEEEKKEEPEEMMMA